MAPMEMAEIDGIWIVKAGVFGAPDAQTQGGAIAIENGRIVGGDNVLAYIGECRVIGTELTGSLHVIRHGDPEYATFFGSKDDEYKVDFVGERLSRDYYEGRLKVRPGVEGRMFMRRLADLPPRSM